MTERGQPSLIRVARATVVHALGHQHPAGGTLGVAAAGVRVRDTVIERSAQESGISADFDCPAIRQVLDLGHARSVSFIKKLNEGFMTTYMIVGVAVYCLLSQEFIVLLQEEMLVLISFNRPMFCV